MVQGLERGGSGWGRVLGGGGVSLTFDCRRFCMMMMIIIMKFLLFLLSLLRLLLLLLLVLLLFIV